MKDYIYYIFKDGMYQEGKYQDVEDIIIEDCYLVKPINSYMSPVYLYKKGKDKSWEVILKFNDFIDFLIKNEKNNIILYEFSPKNIEHIIKAIQERSEKLKDIKSQIKDSKYTSKEFYNINNLFVGNILCNQNILSSYNLSTNLTNQRFIFELIESKNGNMYREIFSGFIVSDISINDYQLSIINIEPITKYYPNSNIIKISNLELFLLQNEINSKKTKKRYIRKKKENS